MTTALATSTSSAHALMSASDLTRRRRVGVITGGLIAALSFPLMIMLESGELPAFCVLLSGSLLASVPMALRGGLGAQVLARALWWQGSLMGALFFIGMGLSSGPAEGIVATAGLTLGCLIALASAARAGLTQQSARFAPVAFRCGLMLSMVLALADTQALLLYGSIMLESHYAGAWQSLPFFASAAVMMAALWGLWNMRMWGFALNIVANVAIAALAIAGVFDLPTILVVGLASTAAAQLLIPIPMIRAMLPRRRQLEL